MTTKFLRLGAAAIFLTSASLLCAAIAPAENLLPADTLAFFTVPDTTAFRAACKTSPQLMFWNDDAMKPFHDKFMAKFNERFIAPLEKDLGLKVADFLALPQGQFTLAVTVNGSNGHDDVPPGLLLLLDAKDKSSALKTNLVALTKKWTDAGRKLRTEKIHGLAFTVVPLTSNDFAGIFPKKTPVSEIGKEPKPAKPQEIFFAQYQSLLVAGNSAGVVDAVAAHLTGSSAPAIADDAIFAADKAAQFRDAPTYYGWFNGDKFFTLISSKTDDTSDGATPMPKFTVAKSLGATGLGTLKSASFALREAHDGSTLALHLTVPEADRTGLLKILALPAKDASAPPFVPADAVKFTRIRLDGKQAWAELQKMVAAISPSGLSSLNAVIDLANTFGQQKNPGFDLRTALFGNLGDDIITYQKAVAGDSLAELSSPPVLYLVAVSNPDQVVEAIKTISAMASPQEAAKEPREFLGRKIYSFAMRAAPARGGVAAPARALYFTTSGGYLALSLDTAILEEYLRSADHPPKPLSDLPGLADAASHVGGTGGGLFSCENQRETMRVAFKVFKGTAGTDSMKLLPADFRDWADFSLLPDYETVQKYFYLSVFGGKTDADGLTVKFFNARPPQLN